jgi:FkbM family methyltransferase
MRPHYLPVKKSPLSLNNMLIKFQDLLYKHKIVVRGVIHVGAHEGQEVNDYHRFGVKNIVLIEPASVQYKKLFDKFSRVAGVRLFNVACGALEGEATMYVETFNTGQSNSLLKPKDHLKHYPEIKFTGTETVPVKPLRKLEIDPTQYNLLNIDVQGYELEVLRGADLTHIDAIYTEVNRAEVYEGCAMVDDLDKFLAPAFTRVDTVWTGQGWGDAIYKRVPVSRNVDVPASFRQPHPFKYPLDNRQVFEEWYAGQKHPDTERIYLPIYWTSYLIRANYGKNAPAMQRLQRFIDGLPRDKKYYTICQFDDGPMVDFKDLDIIVMGMAGGRVDYPLPLISTPHAPARVGGQRGIYASYIGSATHPVRAEVLKFKGRPNWFISDKVHNLTNFCSILNQSTFSLCPRGYGPSSFRIMESLQFGAIPVYISDVFILPHCQNFTEYGVLVDARDVARLPEILAGVNVEALQNNLKDIYRSMFTYEANLNLIHLQLC